MLNTITSPAAVPQGLQGMASLAGSTGVRRLTFFFSFSTTRTGPLLKTATSFWSEHHSSIREQDLSSIIVAGA